MKKPALSTAPVGQTLLTGQKGDLSHFASIIFAIFDLLLLFLLFLFCFFKMHLQVFVLPHYTPIGGISKEHMN